MLTIKVKQTIERFGMLNAGDRVVVAVSGGPDSVCLLHVLQSLAKSLDIVLQVAHLDHMFRGKESADEALFVAGLAKQSNISATIETIDVPAFCRERGLSPQEGARLARYAFLQRAAKTTGASRIATGHTANDQAETLLMRLIRGAGVSGLSAIPPVRENIIRPLIEATRDEVMEYVKAADLAFVTDSTNLKPVYTRNKIRQDLLPMLKSFNPRIVETLASEAALLRDEDEAMETCIDGLSRGVLSQEKNEVVLRREKFNALPQAFRRRLLMRAADLAGAGPLTLSSVQIDEALTFMAAAHTGRTLRLPQNLLVEREYKAFRIGKQAEKKTFSYALALPGLTTIPELGMQVETSILETRDEERGTRDEREKNYIWQAAFDYAKIASPLTCRTRLSGDRFCPAGMGGRSKKLQDYFTDEKIPRQKRDVVPLLVSGNDILWVVGLRTDERFLPNSGAKKILLVGVKAPAEEAHNAG